MKRNILVVGGAGYIGSHCAKRLVKSGYNVIVYDNLSRGFRDAVKYGEFIQGDIGDADTLGHVFSEKAIDAVMHFAAFINVGESVHKPDLYMENNFERTRALLHTMLEHGIRHFIFSSTAAVYGVPEKSPLTENHPRKPINPYGESKYRVELLLEELGRTSGLKSVIFRYFNAAGADPDGELGERHDPETHLIPLILRAALGKGKPLSVFGTDYPTPDGTCIRDYIHVNDLISAHILGLEYMFSENKSGIFNLGNGSGFSVKEVIETAEKVTGLKVPYESHARREGDPPVLVGCADLARKVLKWKTEYPDLEQIVRTAWGFEKNRPSPPAPSPS